MEVSVFFTNLPFVFLLEFHICHGLNVANTTGFGKKMGSAHLSAFWASATAFRACAFSLANFLRYSWDPRDDGKRQRMSKILIKIPGKMGFNLRCCMFSCCQNAHFLENECEKMLWTLNSSLASPLKFIDLEAPTESLVMSLTASLKRSSSSCSVEKLEGPAPPKLTAFVALPK